MAWLNRIGTKQARIQGVGAGVGILGHPRAPSPRINPVSAPGKGKVIGTTLTGRGKLFTLYHGLRLGCVAVLRKELCHACPRSMFMKVSR